MRKLITTQKIQKLNNVYAKDERGAGNANHQYVIKKVDDDMELAFIQFQDGARKESGSISGVIDSDLLEIVRDRLKGFQSGDFCDENTAKALEHIEIALVYLNRRVEDRYNRNVLGTYEQ
jgi:hypothetical protein